MNKLLLAFCLIALCRCQSAAQPYNQLWIPDTLSGTNFNLTIKDTFAQIVTNGNQTITGGINGKFWGPTLFFNKGDEVHMNVQNNLNDSTTLHWHGMHLPAVMDGGPHQIIPPGTVWQPYWTVNNDAATYWYHPHLHGSTTHQAWQGLSGAIVIEGEQEAHDNYIRMAEILVDNKEDLTRLAKMEDRHKKGFQACGRNLSVNPDMQYAQDFFAGLHGNFEKAFFSY